MSATNKPRIEAYIGASGSGKGVSITRRLQELKPPRLLIWDPRDEYGKLGPGYESIPHLVGSFKHAKKGPVRARFVPGDNLPLADAFALICRIAFSAQDLVFVAEELSDVTTASHAPAAWRKCITQGRHQGLHLIGATQRPALIDKTFLGNATYIRCFSLRYLADRKAMAAAMDVDLSQITALHTMETEKKTTINYLERHFRNEEAANAGQIVLSR